MIKRWNLKFVVGALCWAPEINALYAADLFTPSVKVWHLKDPLSTRESDAPIKPPKGKLAFSSGHEKAVQGMKWLGPTECLATCSLDSTVQLWDTIRQERMHVLKGHSKGLRCLEYLHSVQMLLSGGFDSYVTMWDPNAGSKCNVLRGHSCSIVDVKAVLDS